MRPQAGSCTRGWQEKAGANELKLAAESKAAVSTCLCGDVFPLLRF